MNFIQEFLYIAYILYKEEEEEEEVGARAANNRVVTVLGFIEGIRITEKGIIENHLITSKKISWNSQ